MDMGTTSSRIIMENPNRCTNCGHPLQSHKLTRWEPIKKNVKGVPKSRHGNSKRDIPWICVQENCNCTEFFLIRSPSYR